MKISKINTFVILVLLLIGGNSLIMAGNIKGVVSDSLSGETLFGANVMLVGTSLGSASGPEGEYNITNIPSGDYILRFSYIGYKMQEMNISITENITLEINIELSPEIYEGEEVVITALALGQAAAINQQLGSNTIVNVVSKDKLEQLPDANAAESIGRLPGVAIQRDAGEGTKVVVRGLSPKYNSITVNGERIPATDAEDRSVDLSMISSDMLEGIEVFKALTPDKDGDAVGGTVNFVVKKASSGFRGNVRAEGGYNDHENDYGNYRGSFSVSNRFFNDKLGVLATGNLQRANRSSDILDAAYGVVPATNENPASITVENLNLGDRKETRDRYGASLTLDYELPKGSIMLSSLYGRTEREEQRMRKRYRVADAYVEYWLRSREINTDLYTNTLSGDYDFSFMKVNWRTSYSSTQRDMPKSHDSQFREQGAFTNNLVDDKGPKLIPLGAKNNLDETLFYQDFFDTEKINDNDFTAQADFSIPLRLGDDINASLKLGGKYRDKNRDREISQQFTKAFEIDKIGAENPDLFDLNRENKIRINNFIEPNYDIGEFLNGNYEFSLWLDQSKLDNFMDDYRNRYIRNIAIDLENYKAGESIVAGYIMSEINFGDLIMFLPGFRYEKTTNDYSTTLGDAIQNDDGTAILVNTRDSSDVRSYEEFLPMAHLQIKPFDWFDVRFAVTKTLARPDYFNLVPWERITASESLIERGNSKLKHTTAWNYDVFLSFHNNIGLFTVGAFYKKLKNIDYIRTSRITVLVNNRLVGYNLIQPENVTKDTEVYGIEIDLQANLRFLPYPFDGIIFSANLTHLKSKTYFPLMKVEHQTVPPFSTIYTTTFREATLPGQANNVANISLGYEKGDFTGRLSMIYQDKSLETIGNLKENDGYTDAYTRWDFSGSYNVFKNLSVILNVNNITNKKEGAYLGSELFPTVEEYFGMTADLGVKFKF